MNTCLWYILDFLTAPFFPCTTRRTKLSYKRLLSAVRFLAQFLRKSWRFHCIIAASSIAQLDSFKWSISPKYLRWAFSAVEDEWERYYHLTNQNVFEGGSIALSDLLLINAFPLWPSAQAEIMDATKNPWKKT